MMMILLEIISFSLISSSSKYKKEYSSTFPPTILIQVEREYYFAPNEQLILPCKASGFPIPSYSWIRNGNVINDSISRVRGDLMIKSGSEGYFQCVATNFLGSAFSDIAHVRVAYQNEFKAANRDKIVTNVTLGSFLILHCEIPSGNPKPQIYWIVRKRQYLQILHESERITTDFEGNLYFTYVEQGDFQDGSIYQCVINNSLAKVLTYGKEHSIQVTENINNVKSFLLWKSPDHDLALQGQSKKLKCIFARNPLQMITWIKLNSNISKNVRKRGHELFFVTVTFSDQGIYRCLMDKQTWYDTYLSVEAVPTWTNFGQHMLDKSILEGESLTITCNALGVPRPVIKLYYNGNLVRESFISKIDGTPFITIVNVTKTDSKVVQCNASNKHGYVFSNAYINVLAEPPQASESHIEVKVSKGSNVTLNCPVNGWPEPIINWHSNVGKMVATNISTYTIFHLFYDNHFECRAHNKYGEKEVMFFVSAKNKTKVKLTSSNTFAYEGGELILYCSIQAEELPFSINVTWSKNGFDLSPDLTKEIKAKKKHSLSINPAKLGDGGLYTCNASTSYDWGADSKQIFVRGPPLPPKIMQVSNCSSLNAVVSWIDHGTYLDPVIEYLIFRKSSYDVSDNYTTFATSSRILKAHFLLNAWTNYSFFIRSRNIFGLSLPSSFSTNNCSTPSRKPIINPTDVCGESRDPNLLVITWKAIHPRYHFGENFHYILKVKNLSHPQKKHLILKFNGSTTKAMIRNAGIYLPYKVWIHSSNLKELTSNSVKFKWNSVDESKVNGFLQGYQLKMWRTDELRTDDEHTINFTTNIWYPCLRYVDRKLIFGHNLSKRIEFQYHKLTPGTTYVAGVAAMNGAGYTGHLSNLVKFQTKEGKPDKVRNVKITEIASNHLTITWDPPNIANDFLEFDVEYSLADETFYSSTKTKLHTDKNRCKVCDLVENTTYSIAIYVLASADRSEGSTVVVTTLPNTSLSIPVIEEIDTSQKRVNISWSYKGSTFINGGCYYYIEYKQENSNDNKYLQSMPESDKSWIVLNGLPFGSYKLRVMVTSLKSVVRSSSSVIYFQDEPLINRTNLVFSILGIISAIALSLTIILKNFKRNTYTVHQEELENLNGISNCFHSLEREIRNSRSSLKSSNSLDQYQDPDLERYGEDGSYNGVY